MIWRVILAWVAHVLIYVFILRQSQISNYVKGILEDVVNHSDCHAVRFSVLVGRKVRLWSLREFKTAFVFWFHLLDANWVRFVVEITTDHWVWNTLKLFYKLFRLPSSDICKFFRLQVSADNRKSLSSLYLFKLSVKIKLVFDFSVLIKELLNRHKVWDLFDSIFSPQYSTTHHAVWFHSTLTIVNMT